MHFALPPRKSSHPAPYARAGARSSAHRQRQQRVRMRVLVLFGLGACCVLFLLARLVALPSSVSLWSSASAGSEGGRRRRPAPPGTAPVVIVTVLDDSRFSREHLDGIRRNREQYAAAHGYQTFLAHAKDYELRGAPSSWARVPALRHALATHPHTPLFFQLDAGAVIGNGSLALETHIMAPARLAQLMLKDVPVVPPDSVIRTFSHLKPAQVDLVLSQDATGLAPASLLLRQGEWARFFLDTWFDPIYRSYNFQKAEVHALEHIVQWHSTILAKLALVPPRTMFAAHTTPDANADADDREAPFRYQPGDFVLHPAACKAVPDPQCEAELRPFLEKAEKSAGTGGGVVTGGGGGEGKKYLM
ncbi:MAG: hypothetical protein M1826_007521 [Phylliscum demangeonii]|nr:MAG: hypothetical protein M1826_007521 [Phylliscum demangeonii]